MKRLIALLMILTLLIPAIAFADEAVTFSDPVFELKFRQQINRPEGDIFPSDCKSVTSLYIGNPAFPEEDRAAVKEEDKVRSLADVDKFPNLSSIEFPNSAVSDLTPLAQLTKLTLIEAPLNYISDISPIAELTGLYHVVFWENRIENIDALQNLNNLKVLSLFNNKVTDISALSGKIQLTILELHGNQISDFSPVAPIYEQLEYADFSLESQNGNGEPAQEGQGNERQDVPGNLVTLQIDPTLDASAIADTPLVFDDPMFERALRNAMGIYDRPITQKDAYLVREIGIHNDKSEGAMFSDISPLQYFVNLERLSFNSNLISDLSPLASLEKLTMLKVSYNQVKDITPLKNLVNLTELYLEYNRISDISALASLTELRRLNLEENMLVSVLPLQNLTKLESVKVRLVQMDPEGIALLAQFPNLYELLIYVSRY